jgi:hypothetical protein
MVYAWRCTRLRLLTTPDCIAAALPTKGLFINAVPIIDAVILYATISEERLPGIDRTGYVPIAGHLCEICIGLTHLKIAPILGCSYAATKSYTAYLLGKFFVLTYCVRLNIGLKSSLQIYAFPRSLIPHKAGEVQTLTSAKSEGRRPLRADNLDERLDEQDSTSQGSSLSSLSLRSVLPCTSLGCFAVQHYMSPLVCFGQHAASLF